MAKEANYTIYVTGVNISTKILIFLSYKKAFKTYLHTMNSVKEIRADTVAAKGGGVILIAYLNAATQDKAPKVNSVDAKPKA